MQRSLAIEPNESSLSNLGTMRYKKGDYAGAADMYRRAAELNPGDFFYAGFLGDALRFLDTANHKAKDGHARKKDTFNDGGIYINSPLAREATEFTAEHRTRSALTPEQLEKRLLGLRSPTASRRPSHSGRDGTQRRVRRKRWTGSCRRWRSS